MSEPSLILIDGSSFLFRAFHASRTSFITSKGVPTGAALLITNMLKGLIKKYEGHKLIAVFDAHAKTFRHEMYPEYKANRPPMPDELRVQLEAVKKVVTGLGLPLVSIPGVEADDVLGTYAKEATKLGLDTVICTGDKDLAQLVNEHVTLYDSMNEVCYDRQGVIAKYGVPPELIIDFLAIKGDSSDNIPGMPGAGDKTAAALLNGIGGIEEIAAHPERIETLSFRGAKTFASKYLAALPEIRLSYKLATIRTDVPLTLKIEDVRPPIRDVKALLALFTELEFKRHVMELLREEDLSSSQAAALLGQETAGDLPFDSAPAGAFQSEAAGPEPVAPVMPAVVQDFDSLGTKITVISSKEQLEAVAREIKEAGLVALDTETTSLRPEECTLVGISLSVKPKEGYYLPLNHACLEAVPQLSAETVKEVLLPVLNLPSVKIIGHNLKFDLLTLYFAGLELKGCQGDTMVIAHLLDSAQSAGLDPLCLKYLNYANISYEQVTGTGKKKINFSQVPIEQAARYSGEDAEVTLRLYQALMPLLKKEPALLKLYEEVELPLVTVLFKTEREGVLVDGAVLSKLSSVLNGELKQVHDDIITSAGVDFNVASPRQLGKVLFEDLKIPYPRKLAQGKTWSTSEEILSELPPEYDIARLVLRYRELAKLISTYTEKLQPMISKRTGRIYTTFNQSGTVTGRLSCSDPNLQNIPARTPEGKLIRTAFVAPEGYTLLSCDYSQIELRLIAHFTDDRNLIGAFLAGYDIHKATAAEVLHKNIEDVTAQERSHAKATNFGLMYGMGAFGLTRQTGMSMQDAKNYIKEYFARYPSVERYMQAVKDEAHRDGYVTTLMGRRVTVTNINSKTQNLVRAAERAAINAPMQGSAADIIKLAMVKIQAYLDTLPKGQVRMTVQVHDELLFEVKDECLDEVTAKLTEIMEHAAVLKVPLIVGAGRAQNWGDAH